MKNMAESSQTPKRSCHELSPDGAANSSVGKMAIEDLMTQMSSLMDEKLKNIPTKQDVEEIKATVGDLSDKMDVLKTENDSLRAEVEQLKVEKEKDHHTITFLEDHIKRNNIVFRGINTNKSLFQAVKDCCKKNLKITKEINILSVRKLFENDGKLGVVVEFSSVDDVREIFANVKNLKGSKISLDRDLSKDRQQDKRVMLELKKQIHKLKPSCPVMVRNEKMKVERQWFKWNNQKQLMCGKDQGIEMLKKIYGDDISSVNIDYFEILRKINSKN